ncbi:MAG: hypothetical protein CMG60_00965 [Candidatus Marinimicrobia bacterium]|nr:hypothetical protein [Candidatus Neomarinimicrobiota bacterium]
MQYPPGPKGPNHGAFCFIMIHVKYLIVTKCYTNNKLIFPQKIRKTHGKIAVWHGNCLIGVT